VATAPVPDGVRARAGCTPPVRANLRRPAS